MAPLPTLLTRLKHILHPLLPNNRTLRTPSMTTLSNRTSSFTLVGPIRIVCRSLDHRAIVALTAFVAHTKALLDMHRGSLLVWTYNIWFDSGLLGLSPLAARVCGAIAFSEGVAVISLFGMDVTAMIEVVEVGWKYASANSVTGRLSGVKVLLGCGGVWKRIFVSSRLAGWLLYKMLVLIHRLQLAT